MARKSTNFFVIYLLRSVSLTQVRPWNLRLRDRAKRLLRATASFCNRQTALTDIHIGTRSGAAYSPFDFNPADVLTTAFDFSIQQRLILDNAIRITREDAGEDFDEEVELEDDDSPQHPAVYAEPQVPVEKWAHLPTMEGKKREQRAKHRQQRVREVNQHVKGVALRRRHEAAATKLESHLDSEDLPVASSGWVGSGADPFQESVREEFTIEELTGPKYSMRVVDLDGK